ncbi:hypothetical protein OG216_19705 [Streptomycetaceae bacterium NBC_01309]
MPRTTAVASVSGLIAGIAATMAVMGDPEEPTAESFEPIARLGLLVCLFLIAGKAFRGVLDDAMTRTHHAVEAATTRDLHRPPGIAARHAEDGGTDHSHQRLDKLLEALTEERAARAKLQAEYDELANDYNQIVMDAYNGCVGVCHTRTHSDTTLQR